MIRLIVFATICCTVTNAQQVLDSRLIGAPHIQCEESRIRLSIRTNEPFGGNVYAKGFFNKDVCRVRGNGIGNSANITIPIAADCGIRRRRMADPKGLVLEITIVLMFHSKFLTKNDKAYHIECVYMELLQKVFNKLDISDIPSTQLSESVSLQSDMSDLPRCKYEVLDKDENGQAISFAAIGQSIYHRWTCQSPNAGEVASASEKLYCLTVHSCEVDDGQGSVQKLLDINGCSADRALLDEVDYKSDLEAGRQGFVFKFADRPTVYFGCQLRLELKLEWKQQCRRTSEKCKSLTDTSANIKNIPVPVSYGRGSSSEDEDDGTEVTPDFPRLSSTVTTTIVTTPFTTTATLATSTTTITFTPTKVTAQLSTTSRSASAVANRPKLQSPNEETYPSNFVDILLSAPRPNARTDDENVWQTVVTLPKGRSASKEVLSVPASKESQLVSSVGDSSVDPPLGDSTQYERAEEQGQAPYPESPETIPEQSEPDPEPSGTFSEGTSEDAGADTSNDDTNVQVEADGARRRVRLRDVTASGLMTPVFKRRRTSRSTPVSERLLHYDIPMENDRHVTNGGGIRIEKFRLKQPHHLDNDADDAAHSLRLSDSTIRSAVAQSRPGTFIDIDVTAPEVDVFDVPQIPVVRDSRDLPGASESYVQYTRAMEQTKLRDLSSDSDRGNQWCISHQSISIALFTSSFVLVGVFAALIIAFQRVRRKAPHQDSSYVEFTPQRRRAAPMPDYLVGYGGEDSNSASAAARRSGLKHSAYTIHSGSHSSATIA